MHFEIPTGLTDLLQEFTVAVLRRRPDDLVQFASEYFSDRQARRKNQQSENDDSDRSGQSRGVRFPEQPQNDQEENGYTDSDESDFG